MDRKLIIKVCGELETVIEQLTEAQNLTTDDAVFDILHEQIQWLGDVKDVLLTGELSTKSN